MSLIELRKGLKELETGIDAVTGACEDIVDLSNEEDDELDRILTALSVRGHDLEHWLNEVEKEMKREQDQA